MDLMLARNKTALNGLAPLQGRKMPQRSTPALLLAVLFVVQSTASNAQVAAPGAAVATFKIQTAEELRRAKQRGVIGCAVELIVERGEFEWTARDNVTRRRFGPGRHCLDESGLETAEGARSPPPPAPPPGPPAPPPCQSPAGRGC